MKQLKFFMFILLSVTILSCKSDNKLVTDILWESAGNLPKVRYGYWSIATDPNNRNIWACNDKLELYLSTDNGDAWVEKDKLPFNGDVSIVVSPSNGYLFASTIYELYRSTDNGGKWEKILEGAVNGIFFTASGEIYVGIYTSNEGDEGKSFCYYSNDNGNTWISKSHTLPHDFNLLALGKDGTLYASDYDDARGFGVYSSIDSGVTWLPPKNYIDKVIYELSICDDGLIFVTALSKGILKSIDKGVSWVQVNTGFSDDFNGIIYNDVTKDIFVTSVHKVYRSTDLGESWKLENSGFPDENFFNDLIINHKTGQVFIGTHSAVYRTKNYPK
jgi:photosystem II stability/assembly factor-like uncharacterized protein